TVANILNCLRSAREKPQGSLCYRVNQEPPFRNTQIVSSFPRHPQPTEQPPLNPKLASFCSSYLRRRVMQQMLGGVQLWIAGLDKGERKLAYSPFPDLAKVEGEAFDQASPAMLSTFESTRSPQPLRKILTHGSSPRSASAGSTPWAIQVRVLRRDLSCRSL